MVEEEAKDSTYKVKVVQKELDLDLVSSKWLIILTKAISNQLVLHKIMMMKKKTLYLQRLRNNLFKNLNKKY
jgi:hypothetical protein